MVHTVISVLRFAELLMFNFCMIAAVYNSRKGKKHEEIVFYILAILCLELSKF